MLFFVYPYYSCFLSDFGGIQTHDLQNRNLTLYSAKLRSHTAPLPSSAHDDFLQYLCKINYFYPIEQNIEQMFCKKTKKEVRLSAPHHIRVLRV